MDQDKHKKKYLKYKKKYVEYQKGGNIEGQIIHIPIELGSRAVAHAITEIYKNISNNKKIDKEFARKIIKDIIKDIFKKSVESTTRIGLMMLVNTLIRKYKN